MFRVAKSMEKGLYVFSKIAKIEFAKTEAMKENERERKQEIALYLKLHEQEERIGLKLAISLPGHRHSAGMRIR